MVALGFIAAYLLTRRYLERRGLDGDLTGEMFLAALVGGILGARLYFAVEHFPDLIQDPAGVLLGRGGLTWYGGFLLGAITVSLVLAARKAPFAICADAAAPAILAGYVLGRVGCQLSGDGDYGRPSTVPWAMSYPHGTVPTTERVHPTPVYDVLMGLPVLFLLLHLQRRGHRDGTVFGVFLVASGLQRFIVEFWRRNPPVFHGLTEAQLWSVAVALSGFVAPTVFRRVDARRRHLRRAA